MPQKPLEILRNSLDNLRKQTSAKQDHMDAPTATSQPSIQVPVSALILNAAHQEDLAPALAAHPPNTISQAEQQVIDVLDTLVKTGALRSHNWIGIEELLNPVEETVLIDEATDKEIFRAVMDAHERHENSEIMGSDDDSGPAKPCPTATEALQAISDVRFGWKSPGL